ncbi:MAG: UUP1 family membrane protein [Cyanobacteria bacterium J06638_28]
MSRTIRTMLLALFLTAVGLTVFFHKVLIADMPLLPNQTLQSWYIEAKVALQSGTASSDIPDRIQMQLPIAAGRFEIFRENFEHDGLEQQILPAANRPNRRVEFTRQVATPNANILFYRAIVDEQRPVKNSAAGVSSIGRQLVNQQFSRFDDGSEVADNLQENLPEAAILSLLAEASQATDDTLTVVRNLYQLALETADLRIQAVQDTLGGDVSAVELTTFLLQRGQVEARLGNGLLLTQEEAYASDFVHWLEIRDGDSWLAYDPISDRFGPQDRYFTWWYGQTPAVNVEGEGNAELEVLVRPNTDVGFSQALWRDRAAASPLIEYSLLRLPLATQGVFQVLVLIPIGALVISLLHQIIGIQTFGTFTPVLIALSFRETGLWTGIAAFTLIVALGLLIRAHLERLQLLVVPRLAAILTTTVLIMMGLAVLLDTLQIRLGLSLSLFPIVILAMTIEKAALMWEEDGPTEVGIAGLGTVAVAIIGFLCMTNSYVQHLAFNFPELLLPILGLNLLAGRYNGYKLSEYLRFQAMQRQLSQSEG